MLWVIMGSKRQGITAAAHTCALGYHGIKEMGHNTCSTDLCSRLSGLSGVLVDPLLTLYEMS